MEFLMEYVSSDRDPDEADTKAKGRRIQFK